MSSGSQDPAVSPAKTRNSAAESKHGFVISGGKADDDSAAEDGKKPSSQWMYTLCLETVVSGTKAFGLILNSNEGLWAVAAVGHAVC